MLDWIDAGSTLGWIHIRLDPIPHFTGQNIFLNHQIVLYLYLYTWIIPVFEFVFVKTQNPPSLNFKRGADKEASMRILCCQRLSAGVRVSVLADDKLK